MSLRFPDVIGRVYVHTSLAGVPQTGAKCFRPRVALLIQAMVGTRSGLTVPTFTRRIESHHKKHDEVPRHQGHSLRLDVGRTDHLAPLLGFIGEQLAEVGR